MIHDSKTRQNKMRQDRRAQTGREEDMTQKQDKQSPAQSTWAQLGSIPIKRMPQHLETPERTPPNLCGVFPMLDFQIALLSIWPKLPCPSLLRQTADHSCICSIIPLFPPYLHPNPKGSWWSWCQSALMRHVINCSSSSTFCANSPSAYKSCFHTWTVLLMWLNHKRYVS